jgi:aminodeoxyfutalosine synthase
MTPGRLHDSLAEKVEAGQRLTLEEGLALHAEPDLDWVGRLANRVRERAFGERTTYVVNLHLNYTNLCVGSCLFCAFSRQPGQAGAYEMTTEEMVQKVEVLRGVPGAEVHIVGGLHPTHPYSYYPALLDLLHGSNPDLHLKAFTAVEIDHFANLAGRSVEWVLQDLKAHGLGSMPGGGAEILAERIRQKLFRHKIGPDRWLEIHQTAHRLGIPTSATMLAGHIESPEERLVHMDRLRRLQDQTGGFLAFIPLRFHPDNTPLSGLPLMGQEEMLRTVALGRLMLDNFPHIKAYWVMSGLETAAQAQWFGADDLDGTVVQERITHMAGCQTPAGLTEDRLCAMIRQAGRVPVRRDALYRVAGSAPVGMA